MTPTSTGEHLAVIDPRLRARRGEVQRRQGRRRLRRLLAVLGVVAAGAAAVGIALSPLLDVDRVVVRGATRSGPAAVDTAAGIDRGQPLATVDVDAAQAAVEAMPWVSAATVERSWPGTVAISVAERQPVAAVSTDDGRWALVDARRRQLAVVGADEIAGLPRVEGLAPAAAAGSELGPDAAGALELARHFPEAMASATYRVVVDTDGSIEVVMTPSGAPEVRARFGRPDRLADKVVALASLLDHDDQWPAGTRIDVRVPEAPVLTKATS